MQKDEPDPSPSKDDWKDKIEKEPNPDSDNFRDRWGIDKDDPKYEPVPDKKN